MFKSDSPIINFLSSLKLTVASLIWLSVLVIWGTIYQVDHGLYIAQKKFFDSYYFFVADYIPVPSTQLIMWVLFFNLLAVMIFRTNYNSKKLFINFVHFAVLFLMLSCFFIANTSTESFMTLGEGEKSNQSSDYYLWELIAWDPSSKQLKSFEIGKDSKNQSIKDQNLGIEIKINNFYENAALIGNSDLLIKIKTDTEYSNNTAAVICKVSPINGQEESQSLSLIGNTSQVKQAKLKDKDILLSLRKKKYKLPISLQLIDFNKEEHTGTQIAKSYRSLVRIEDENGSRKLKVSMNKPLRHGPYTFYQASFSLDEAGNEFSTFAIVKNHGRLLPYIFSLLISLGLAIYFLFKLFRFKKEEI